MKKVFGKAVCIFVLALSGCGHAASTAAAESFVQEENTAPPTSAPASLTKEAAEEKEAEKVMTYDPIWQSRMRIPSADEIHRYNQDPDGQAPYIAAWMETGDIGRYTEICMEIKADYMPLYTYWCTANFHLDYSELLKQYTRVYTEYNIGGYGGLQQIGEYYDNYEGGNGILSFWDVYCEDSSGHVDVIHARQTYPKTDESQRFDGEGEGVHHLSPYKWQAGKWYLMLYQCAVSPETGNSTILQWVQDMASGRWTLLAEFDLGVPNVAFTGDFAVFLEDWLEKTAGEVRTMEIRNVRVRKQYSPTMTSIRSGYFLQDFDHAGSYRYGTDGDTFWMISSGIPGLVDRLQDPETLTVNDGTSAVPYK